MSSSKNNNILSDENNLNDFIRSIIVTSLSLKIVIIENIRDPSAERELFIISLSTIINTSENLLIFANIELSLARELKNAKETSLVNNTSLNIDSLDLVISLRSILTIE